MNLTNARAYYLYRAEMCFERAQCSSHPKEWEARSWEWLFAWAMADGWLLGEV